MHSVVDLHKALARSGKLVRCDLVGRVLVRSMEQRAEAGASFRSIGPWTCQQGSPEGIAVLMEC